MTEMDQMIEPRKLNLIRAMQTFPKRRFILLGDVSNSDAMQAYPEMVSRFPGQVQVRLSRRLPKKDAFVDTMPRTIQCILMRNISATDATFSTSFTTEYFKGVEPSLYQFFRTPVSWPALHLTA